MTVLYLTEYITKRYAVTFQNIGCMKVRKFEGISNHEYNISCVKPFRVFLGKGEVCDMTLMSRAFVKSVFDGNTILLKINEEYGRHRYIYINIGGDTVCFFLTNDNIYKYISNMGNNLTPYSIL